MDGPSRNAALAAARARVDDGRLAALLSRFVAARTDSPAGRTDHLHQFLGSILAPWLVERGFDCSLHRNPDGRYGDLLIGERREDDRLPTALLYCHVDTVGCDAAGWSPGIDPLELTTRDGRWYGRGTADNKGQLAVNLMALDAVIEERASALGCNIRLLAESGEEVGSPGLHDFCAAQHHALAADVLIASDGPRLSAAQPTLFLGSRGVTNVDLRIAPRTRAFHSGNWGGVLSNPAVVLAHALASLVGPRGEIRVAALRPGASLAAVRSVLSELTRPDADDLGSDDRWGEPGLSRTERLFGWNTLEVLALSSGSIEAPANAIPAEARATVQLRCVIGTDIATVPELIRAHLAEHGFTDVEVTPGALTPLPPTRTDPDQPWVRWARRSIASTLNGPVAVLPNIGGSIPNDAFADVLGLPTLWVPHSYPACGQHGADEHLLEVVAREGAAIMAGLFWDLGDIGSNGIAAA